MLIAIWANLTYWALLGVAALAAPKRVVIGTLCVTITFVVGVTAAASLFIG